MRKKKKISQIQDGTKPNWLGCVSMLGGFARHHRAIKITRLLLAFHKHIILQSHASFGRHMPELPRFAILTCFSKQSSYTRLLFKTS